MNSKKRILIAPLNWGLGHATRCIPVINKLKERGHEVIIGANGMSAELLKKEFPSLQHIEIPGYDFRYGRSGNLVWPLLLQAPSFLSSINREHELLDQLIATHAPDIVISDNRYGLWSRKIPSVLITHQIFIKAPFSFAGSLLTKFIFSKIENFDHCWIPDLPDNEMNLSGDLSHKLQLPQNCRFIGLLSRFNGHIKKGTGNNILAIISGPEPQRTIFQQILEKQLPTLEQSSVIVAGNLSEIYRRNGNMEVFPMMDSNELYREFQKDPIVISRCGYSSLMDYIALGIDPIVVPTPGQTEQEYLAERSMQKKWCYSMAQDELHIKKGIEEKENYKFPLMAFNNKDLLESAIIELIG